MSTLTLDRPRPLVLADVLARTRAHDIALVLGAALLTAAFAQVVIPVPNTPIAITGQTFAVLLTAASLGPLRGMLGQLTYVALGAVGLPFYADAESGFQHVTGASGGYLIGFIPAAYLIGLAARYGYDRQLWKAVPLFVAGSLVIYAVGVPWLAIAAGFDASKAISAGFTPFILGDLIKAALAGMLTPLLWKLVKRDEHE